MVVKWTFEYDHRRIGLQDRTTARASAAAVSRRLEFLWTLIVVNRGLASGSLARLKGSPPYRQIKVANPPRP
jgi:hypothetical protein